MFVVHKQTFNFKQIEEKHNPILKLRVILQWHESNLAYFYTQKAHYLSLQEEEREDTRTS